MIKQKNSNADSRLSRRKRMMGWTFLFMILSVVLLPLGSYVYTDLVASAQAADQGATSNPRSNYWRAVRGGQEGYTATKGQETNVLIQNGGENWRNLRNGPMATIGGFALIFTLLAIIAYHMKHGAMKLDEGRSGKTITRWSKFDRILHWSTAVLFILLSITGLSLLFGRAVLIPILGLEGFAVYADFAKTIHNYLGPLFVAVLLILVLSWLKNNILNHDDIRWFKSGGGGIVGHKHVSCGRFNAGEKVWFWLVTILGLAVGITGLILDFPNFDQSRNMMQNTNLIHATISMAWLAVAFGHIYIGTVGSEGSLDGMVTGEVDENWAKQHHDLWYDEVKQGTGETSASVSGTETSPG
ncbi:MAG: formate dehydrogenase subunit gamma [Gammaproteobacteria bacterium]|nr:formate dehydrogenase subunit gamma [Gammaproteobacteria bacterium]